MAAITGTASDAAVVTNVWYQVNHGGWQPAAGTTNWTASFTPTYGGTNVIQACAVNNYGDLSATSTVAVKYLAGAVLTLNTNGLGGITPNLNSRLLPLGTNYVLTAVPAAGFKFTEWTGSVTNKQAALSFIMATNLSFTANFAETTKPVVTITSPTANQKVGGLAFSIQGTATDNWQVTNVWYKLNSGGWLTVNTTNNYKTWSVTHLTLTKGTNLIRAYGLDLGGNYSLTNSVSVVATNAPVTPDALVRALVVGGPPAVLITGAQLTPDGLRFNLQITGGTSGDIQVSTNLTSWETVTNFAGTNTTLQFCDPGATNASRRFYRAVAP
jgi:hypothetical protein